jgi:hypothetical protein
MKKNIIIGILLFVCQYSSAYGSDALPSFHETSTEEVQNSVVAEYQQAKFPKPDNANICESTLPQNKIAINENNSIITRLKPTFHYLKDGTIKIVVASKELAQEIFTKDNLLTVIAYTGGFVFVAICFVYDMAVSVLQTIKWFLLS